MAEPTRQQLEQAFIQADEAGNAEDAQAFADALRAMDAAAPAEPEPQWNPANTVPQVIFDTGKEIGKGVIAPFQKETYEGLYNLATEPEARAAVGKHFKDRYGSLKGFRKAFYENPSEVIAELSGLAALGTGTAVAAGKGAAKVAGTAGIKSGRDVIEAAKAFRNNPSKQLEAGRLVESDIPVEGAENRLIAPSKGAKIADEILYDKLIESGWTPQKARERLKWLGKEGLPADLAPFEGVAEAAAQLPKGAARAKRVLESRARGAESRLLKTVDSTLSDENFYATLKDLSSKRTAEARPDYIKAFSDNTPLQSKTLDELLARPDVKTGINQGIKIILDENAGVPDLEKLPIENAGIKFNAAGDPVYTGVPTLRVLDAALVGLDKQLDAFRGPNGKLTSTRESRALMGLRNRLQTELVNLSGGKTGAYAQAREKWAGPTRMMEVQKLGRDILDNDPELNAEIVSNLTKAEKDYMQIGLARAIKDDIRDNPMAAARYFNKGTTRDAIRMVFGKKDFRKMHRQVLRELKMQETKNRNLANSATAKRGEALRDIRERTGEIRDDVNAGEIAGLGADVVAKNPFGITRFLGRLRSKKSKTKAEKLTKDVADEISSFVMSRDPAVAARQMQRFAARINQRPTPVPKYDRLRNKFINPGE